MTTKKYSSFTVNDWQDYLFSPKPQNNNQSTILNNPNPLPNSQEAVDAFNLYLLNHAKTFLLNTAHSLLKFNQEQQEQFWFSHTHCLNKQTQENQIFDHLQNQSLGLHIMDNKNPLIAIENLISLNSIAQPSMKKHLHKLGQVNLVFFKKFQNVHWQKKLFDCLSNPEKINVTRQQAEFIEDFLVNNFYFTTLQTRINSIREHRKMQAEIPLPEEDTKKKLVL